MAWVKWLRERDEPADFYVEWVRRAQAFHGGVIGYIEGLLILAATQFAVHEYPTIVTWALYILAYAAVLLLTSVYARALMMLLLVRLPVRGRAREWVLHGATLVVLALNVWLVGAMDIAVREIISAGLGV